VSSLVVHPVKLAFRGVLIERPCAHCDTVDLHFDGHCPSGPCTVCGQPRRFDGWPSHPLDVHGQWRTELPLHDFTPGTYSPADFGQDLSAAFLAIVDQARQIGLPEHYTSDLFRDYQALMSLGPWRGAPKPRQFIWAVRSTGTDLIQPHAGLMTEPRLRSNERFFAWDETCLPGLWLCEVSESSALGLLQRWHAAQQERAVALGDPDVEA